MLSASFQTGQNTNSQPEVLGTRSTWGGYKETGSMAYLGQKISIFITLVTL